MFGLRFVDIKETNTINSYVMENLERKELIWFTYDEVAIENAQQNVEQSNQVSSSQSNSLQIMSTPPQQLVNREDNTSQAPISLDTDIPSLDIEPVSSN